ncbi:MAG: tRNA (pseudouridine(54)-N(1))-methyltransferase TrmY [Candidatus Aenigmatarchaeota archaeon]
MREFIVYSRKGRTSSDFTLKDLPGNGGRMDLNARCVISALWLSRDMRRDSRLILSMNGPPEPPLALAFDGKELERVSPDERNVAIWIQKALDEAKATKEEWKEVHSGIYLTRKSFQDLVKEREERKLYVLHESGKDIRGADFGETPVFVLGDHIGLPKKEEGFVERFGAEKISLGPESYFCTHSITLVHNELDRRGV